MRFLCLVCTLFLLKKQTSSYIVANYHSQDVLVTFGDQNLQDFPAMPEDGLKMTRRYGPKMTQLGLKMYK